MEMNSTIIKRGIDHGELPLPGQGINLPQPPPKLQRVALGTSLNILPVMSHGTFLFDVAVKHATVQSVQPTNKGTLPSIYSQTFHLTQNIPHSNTLLIGGLTSKRPSPDTGKLEKRHVVILLKAKELKPGLSERDSEEE